MTHTEIAERVIGNIVEAGPLALSPDGAEVAFVVNRVDLGKNKYFSQIWLAPTDGSTPPRVLTAGERDKSPVWSPDGRSLAFVSQRGGGTKEASLDVIPVGEAGERRTVATMTDSIVTPQWSPDGRWIAFASRTQDDRYAAEDESWQAPRKIERFFTRLNGEGWVFDRPLHLYVTAADGTSAAPRNLTPGEFQHDGISWLPDSSAVVSSALRHHTWDFDFAVDLHLVTLAGEITPLTHQTGNYRFGAVSPDGAHIAFIGIDDPQTSPQNSHVGIVPVGGGEHIWLSRALDRTFEATAGTRPPVWLDESTLLASAEDRGETHLFRVHCGGGAPIKVTRGPITVKAFDAAAGTIVYNAGAVDAVSDLFVITGASVALDQRARLTNFASNYRAVADPLTWERFSAPCTDGSGEIDAWIMRPAGFELSAKYPVLLNVHGGPHTQYGETLFDEAQMQAAAGFVVVMSNPRGGSGREQSWGQSILGPKHPKAPGTGWGTVDVDDILSVLDTALARYPFTDGARVGMLGGSYGGFMATWLAGRRGERFTAICSERAVNNMLTEEFTSDISTIFRVEHGPTHVDDPAEYARMSPIQFVRDIDIPLLIVHSENDLRCPINQAEELFVAMRLLGKDVTFYRFPGETHELSRSGSPVHRRQRAEIILDFFAEHLKNSPAPGADGSP